MLSRSSRRGHRAPAPQFRPTLETLDDRRLPSISISPTNSLVVQGTSAAEIITIRPNLSGDIRIRPEDRPAFLDDLQRTLQELFTRYGGAQGDAFRLAVACYPKGNPDE